jgi:Tol biopolymer transport system component
MTGFSCAAALVALYPFLPLGWLSIGEATEAVVQQTSMPLNFTLSFVTPTDERSIFESVLVSSRGQLAFMREGVLFAESRPGSREYLEVGRYVRVFAWSPDGSRLAYSQQSTAGLNDPTAVYDLRLWSAVDGSDISLAERIPNYPAAPYLVSGINWSPDGSRILMNLAHRNALSNTGTYTMLLATADLQAGTYSETSVTLRSGPVPIVWPVWLTNQEYILQQSCGSPCASFFAFDYEGQRLWAIQGTWGAVAYGPQGNFLINVGGWNGGNPSVDAIDVATGAIQVLWEKPRTTSRYFVAFVEPSLSPDEQLITFNFGPNVAGPGSLYIIGRNGRERGRYANTLLLDWRSNHELAVKERLDTGQYRLAYRSLDGGYEVVWTTSYVIEDGVWSPDGDIFAFTTYRLDDRVKQLYFWQPGNGEPQLIYSTDPNQELIRLTWLPDSRRLYFAVKASGVGEQLWLVETGQ